MLSKDMGIILSLSKRRNKKAEAAAREQEKKVEQLCEMFPMLEKDTLATVLDANEGDIEKTMEMFMPINPATKEEHQKRPASRAGAGPESPPRSPRNRPAASSVHIEELIAWASSGDIDAQYQSARSFADLTMTEEQVFIRFVPIHGHKSSRAQPEQPAVPDSELDLPLKNG